MNVKTNQRSKDPGRLSLTNRTAKGQSGVNRKPFISFAHRPKFWLFSSSKTYCRGLGRRRAYPNNPNFGQTEFIQYFGHFRIQKVKNLFLIRKNGILGNRTFFLLILTRGRHSGRPARLENIQPELNLAMKLVEN